MHWGVIWYTNIIATDEIIETTECCKFHSKKRKIIEINFLMRFLLKISYRAGRMTTMCDFGNESRKITAVLSKLYLTYPFVSRLSSIFSGISWKKI